MQYWLRWCRNIRHFWSRKRALSVKKSKYMLACNIRNLHDQCFLMVQVWYQTQQEITKNKNALKNITFLHCIYQSMLTNNDNDHKKIGAVYEKDCQKVIKVKQSMDCHTLPWSSRSAQMNDASYQCRLKILKHSPSGTHMHKNWNLFKKRPLETRSTGYPIQLYAYQVLLPPILNTYSDFRISSCCIERVVTQHGT